MRRNLHITAALILLAAATLPAVAQAPAPPSVAGPRTTAEIRIGLPDGVEPRVVVSSSESSISVELPKGSSFPVDLEKASGGFLRGGQIEDLGDGRLRLDLQLAGGVLERVEYVPASVTLFFSSRFDLASLQPDTAGEYRIGPSDKLLITVHNRPELTSQPEVAENGTITAPLVGDVRAAGLTPRGLALRLSELLGREYLVSPKVDVQVREYLSQWAMVSGEVRAPTRVALRGGTRLKEALTEAGGFTDEAGEQIVISRQSADGGMGMKVARAAFESGDANPTLHHGDIVTVSKIRFCFVDGEVRRPGKYPIERGLTLMKAITLSGGLTDWADAKEIRVIREGDASGGNVYNLKRIRDGRQADPELTGGEVIVVKRRFL